MDIYIVTSYREESMDIKLTKEDLIAFEDDIAQCFNNALIRAPIHLSFDNESQLLELYQDITPQDWICATWRAHYHCLLKGVPSERLKKDILAGKSIELCYSDFRIFSSAIVGGNISIALGIAMDIKRKQGNNKVFCFVGDMTSETGQFKEALCYCRNNSLPLIFVIEDNEFSVCTNTRKVWNTDKLTYEPENYDGGIHKSPHLYYYRYNLHQKYKHAGTGRRIQF